MSEFSPHWPPLRPELSVDLIHAIVKDKKIIRKSAALLRYLQFCCRITALNIHVKQLLEQCGEELASIAELRSGIIYYNEDCQRPLPAAAYPVEDLSNILLAMLKFYGPNSRESIARMCEDDFKIKVSQQTVEQLFFTGKNGWSHALRSAYNVERIPRYTEFESEYRHLFAQIRDEICVFVRKNGQVFEFQLLAHIFEKFNLALDPIMVAIIYRIDCWGIHVKNVYEPAFVDFASVFERSGCITFVRADQSAALHGSLWLDLGVPQRKIPIFIHDFLVNQLPLDVMLEWRLQFSWFSIDVRPIATATERVRELDWRAVELVVVSVGEIALLTYPNATPEGVFAEVKELVKTIKEKTAKNSKIELWTLPVRPEPRKKNSKAIELNKMFELLAESSRFVTLQDFNKAMGMSNPRDGQEIPFRGTTDGRCFLISARNTLVNARMVLCDQLGFGLEINREILYWQFVFKFTNLPFVRMLSCLC